MSGDFKILAINPGSTSTKVALFEGERELWNITQRYDVNTLKAFPNVMAQEDFRLSEIELVLKQQNTALEEIDAFVGRGGVLRPIPGGTYAVNEKMLDDLRSCRYGAHASNLGAPIAWRLASESGGKPSFIVDPVVVDELADIARISGLPEAPRRSIFHALNQKFMARRLAAELGLDYENAKIIVTHMGGGVSVGVHDGGHVIDVNNALEGDGPFTPERAGILPNCGFIDMCYSGSYTFEQVQRKIAGDGGMVAHLGTNDLREVERQIRSGDERARLVYEAMAYQIVRAIGASATIVNGKVDAILLTGGIAHSKAFVELIKDRVSFIAPVYVRPGEEEMQALVQGALRVLRGVEAAKEY